MQEAIKLLKEEYANATENMRTLGKLHPNGDAREFLNGYKLGLLKAVKLVYQANGKRRDW